jgi:hypothetical protein
MQRHWHFSHAKQMNILNKEINDTQSEQIRQAINVNKYENINVTISQFYA